MRGGINDQGGGMAEYEVNGVKLSVPDGMLTDRIAGKLASGGYEGHEARAALMRLRPGQRVLELGSGLGYIAALCAGVTGADNVVTVEANPAMLPVIRANLARNEAGGVTVLHGAVTGADDAATVGFQTGTAFWGAHIATADTSPEAVVEVPRLSLPALLAKHRPHVVIMDIEGAEAHLFGAPWPGHVRAVVMELHPGRYPDTVVKSIVDCMSASGMTYDPGPSRGRILCFRKLRGK
jgi:FkbM family methyltransferase